MPVTKTALQLTSRQSRMLADMGIDVWYPRTATGTETRGVDTEQQTAAKGLASLKSALQARSRPPKHLNSLRSRQGSLK